MALTERVLKGIEKTYAEADRAQVVQLLTDADFPEDVLIAIIRLSRGKLAKVPELVGHAKGDYRDVLAWSQQPLRTYIAGVLRPGPNPQKNAFLSMKLLRQWKIEGK